LSVYKIWNCEWCAGSSSSAINMVHLWFWREAYCCEIPLYTNNCLVYKFCIPVSSIKEWITYFSWKPCNNCIFHYLYIWHERLTWQPEGWRVKCVINSFMTDTVINTDYFPKEQKRNVTCNGDATCFVLNIIQINYGFKKAMYIQRWLQKCWTVMATLNQIFHPECTNMKKHMITNGTITLAATNQLGWITHSAWIQCRGTNAIYMIKNTLIFFYALNQFVTPEYKFTTLTMKVI
jgi:hypothetical protein